MPDGEEEEMNDSMLIWDNILCKDYIVEFDVTTNRDMPDAPEKTYYEVTSIKDTDGNELSGDLYTRIELLWLEQIK